MSAFGGKADIIHGLAKGPLIAKTDLWAGISIPTRTRSCFTEASSSAIIGPSLRGHLGNVGTKWVNTKEGLRAMAIKRVWIEDGCISCSNAENICPEVFKVVDTNTVIEGVDLSRFEDKIKEAAESCPVEVIKYE